MTTYVKKPDFWYNRRRNVNIKGKHGKVN
jgi:hypothetical protein